MTPPEEAPDARQRRLEEALGVWLGHVEGQAGAETDAHLLDSHPELRDLLEPMLGAELTPGDGAPGEARLSDFKIVKELGRGGMGIVYEAEQVSLRRRVALKVLPPAFAQSVTAVVRFRREARSAAALDHPGIVKIHTVGDDPQSCFHAMELIDGPSLAKVLERLRARAPDGAARLDGTSLWAAIHDEAAGAPPPPPTAWPKDHARVCAGVIARIADALEHAHSRGIVHRDVKPGNILLRLDGTPMLSDFGLARHEDQPGVSDTGTIAGTPHYLAPEQITAKKRVEPRSDIYSLGATLYEMLTLRRPFAGDSTAAILHAITTREPERPERLNARLPRDLVAILGKTLAKEPGHRYATARELAEDLRAWLEMRPVRARPVRAWQRAARWAKREPLKAGLSAAVVLVMVVALVLALDLSAGARGRAAGEAMLRQQQLDEALCDAFEELSEGEAARSEAHLRRALAFEADNPEAIAGLSLLRHTEQGPAGALEVLDAFPAAAGDVALLRLRAAWLAESGDTAAARRIEARLPPEGSQRTPLDLFVSAEVDLLRGHRGDEAAFARAAELLARAAVAGARARPLYWFELAHAAGHTRDARRVQLAETAIQANWPDSALGAFWVGFAYEFLDREKAGAMMRRALEKNPGREIARFNYGVWLMVDGQLQESTQMLERCCSARPTWVVAWQKFADSALRAHDVARAKKACDRLLELAPRSGRTQLYVARLHYENRDLDPALAAVERAVRALPSEPDSYLVRGLCRAAKGDREGAIADLERTVAIAPSYASAWYKLGVTRARLKDVDGAIEAYRKAIEIDGGQSVARINLAQILMSQKVWDEARTQIEAALVTHPAMAMAHIAKLRLLRDRDGPDAALGYCRTWAGKAPDEPEAHLQLARMLLEPFAKGSISSGDAGATGQIAEGRKSAERAATLTAKGNGQALWALGEAQLLQGDLDDAQSSLAAAKQLLGEGGGVNAYYVALTDNAITRLRRELKKRKG